MVSTEEVFPLHSLGLGCPIARDRSFPEKPCYVHKLDRQWAAGIRCREKVLCPRSQSYQTCCNKAQNQQIPILTLKIWSSHPNCVQTCTPQLLYLYTPRWMTIASAAEDNRDVKNYCILQNSCFLAPRSELNNIPCCLLQNLCRSMYMMHNAVTLHLQMNYSSASKL